MTEQTDVKLKNATWLPAWYIEKHTYTGVFVVALALFSILLGIWMTAGDDDVGENYDGIPDHHQLHLLSPYIGPYQFPTMPIPYLMPSAPPQYYYGQAQQEHQSSRPIPPAPMSPEERLQTAQEGNGYAVYPDGYRERIDVSGNRGERTRAFRNGVETPPCEGERRN